MVDLLPVVNVIEYRVYDARSDKYNLNDELNIAYGVDKNYLDWVGVSITSVVINNVIKTNYHIIADEYNDAFLNNIEKLANQYKLSITLYLINADCLKKFPVTKVWSYAMYFRLFAFQMLSSKLDKLLYLDADVFCKGKLDELVAVDLSDVTAAVVLDLDSMQNKAALRLNDKNIKGFYFNSGVVYANLRLWEKQDLTNRILRKLLSGDYKYPDQDVLNLLLRDKVKYLPRKFNTIYTLKNELQDKTHLNYKKTIFDETVLIHFTGVTKPWHKWASYPSAIYYQKALEQSPWKNSQPRDAHTIMEFKKRYKHFFVQHKYFSGIKAGIEYLFKKHARK